MRLTGERDGAAGGERVAVVFERDEDGYLVASVPALSGCHSQARSPDELMERVEGAIQLCLEVRGEEVKEPLELVGIQRDTE